jgi:hypothetical protein
VVGFRTMMVTTIANFFNITGSHTEAMYALMTYGIPVKALPLRENGDLKTASHHKWLAKQQAMEIAIKKGGCAGGGSGTRSGKKNDLLDDSGIIDVPSHSDVILRRGGVYQVHPGNLRMRGLVEEYKEEYDSMPVGGKGRISMKVVLEIKNTDNGRFLTQDPGGWWVEVSDKEAQRRVSKSFRTARSTTSTPAGASKSCGKTSSAFKKTGNGNKRLRVFHDVCSPTSDPCETLFAVFNNKSFSPLPHQEHV